MIAKGNTQVVLSAKNNQRLRMMAAKAGVSAKSFLGELIWEKWKDSPLAGLDEESADEEGVHSASIANARGEA